MRFLKWSGSVAGLGRFHIGFSGDGGNGGKGDGGGVGYWQKDLKRFEGPKGRRLNAQAESLNSEPIGGVEWVTGDWEGIDVASSRSDLLTLRGMINQKA